jgi:hypothetical protein
MTIPIWLQVVVGIIFALFVDRLREQFGDWRPCLSNSDWTDWPSWFECAMLTWFFSVIGFWWFHWDIQSANLTVNVANRSERFLSKMNHFSNKLSESFRRTSLFHMKFLSLFVKMKVRAAQDLIWLKRAQDETLWAIQWLSRVPHLNDDINPGCDENEITLWVCQYFNSNVLQRTPSESHPFATISFFRFDREQLHHLFLRKTWYWMLVYDRSGFASSLCISTIVIASPIHWESRLSLPGDSEAELTIGITSIICHWRDSNCLRYIFKHRLLRCEYWIGDRWQMRCEPKYTFHIFFVETLWTQMHITSPFLVWCMNVERPSGSSWMNLKDGSGTFRPQFKPFWLCFDVEGRKCHPSRAEAAPWKNASGEKVARGWLHPLRWDWRQIDDQPNSAPSQKKHLVDCQSEMTKWAKCFRHPNGNEWVNLIIIGVRGMNVANPSHRRCQLFRELSLNVQSGLKNPLLRVFNPRDGWLFSCVSAAVLQRMWPTAHLLTCDRWHAPRTPTETPRLASAVGTRDFWMITIFRSVSLIFVWSPEIQSRSRGEATILWK